MMNYIHDVTILRPLMEDFEKDVVSEFTNRTYRDYFKRYQCARFYEAIQPTPGRTHQAKIIF